ncbi:MAG: integrase arm-type DNA-binding domain-containing protein [bacterium]|nr:integrase arm-type DNA-binding domain-containing protein [bacterium]MDE0439499.1 integrase arm-type DNA-binding domain-containing protein [bacterium]
MPKRTAAFVRSVTKPGKYGDQHGLILRVQPSGAKAWIWRGTVNGKRRDLGLGRYPYVSLAEARAKAFEYRKEAMEGGDPSLLRSGAIPTFAAATEAVIVLHAGRWKNSTTVDDWRSSLGTYVLPAIGSMRVDKVTTADVMDCLSPIWNAKPETARRVRQRVARVMRWTMAQGYRQDNPAGDAVLAALPKQEHRQKHHRALPHREVTAAVRKVRAANHVDPTVRLAFEFVVLTAARSGEVRGALWSEIDLETATWTIPAGRMKGGREHRVPLSGPVLELLAEARLYSDGPLVFPRRTGGQIPAWMLGKLPGRIGIDSTLHGMRSSFRDWCGESGVAREVAEACLAHRVGNVVEQAYARSDLLQRRRELMEAWAQYAASDRG